MLCLVLLFVVIIAFVFLVQITKEDTSRVSEDGIHLLKSFIFLLHKTKVIIILAFSFHKDSFTVYQIILGLVSS